MRKLAGNRSIRQTAGQFSQTYPAEELSTTANMRGRVMATRVGVGLGGTAMGAPLVGWIANHYGPRWSLGTATIAALLAAFVALIMPPTPMRPEDCGDRSRL